MDDPPYTTPEEDPFNVQPIFFQQPRRRRSSMLDKWIKDQQIRPVIHERAEASSSCVSSSSDATTPLHPYLAYPELGRLSLDHTAFRDDVTVNSYDLVDDEDIPHNDEGLVAPSTPPAAHSRRHSRNLLTPNSFRNFNISFKSASPADSLSTSESFSPRRPSRMSLFARTPRSSTGTIAGIPVHNRSASLGTVEFPGSSPPTKIYLSGASRWRPSVLGHFSQSTASQSSTDPSDTVYTPSRPSVSSADTYHTQTSFTTPTIESCTSSSSKPSLVDSIRSRSRSQRNGIFKTHNGTASVSSVWSQNYPAPRPGMAGILCSEDTHHAGSSSTIASRAPFAPKPGSYLDNLDDLGGENHHSNTISASQSKGTLTRGSVAFTSAGGTRSRVTFSSLSSRNQKKKKKLIISGIGANEMRKFEGVKRWCETFGEVRQIMRMPNGDLQVDFRLADVADTVCRLRAKVYITGVGSVQLSWCYSSK